MKNPNIPHNITVSLQCESLGSEYRDVTMLLGILSNILYDELLSFSGFPIINTSFENPISDDDGFESITRRTDQDSTQLQTNPILLNKENRIDYFSILETTLHQVLEEYIANDPYLSLLSILLIIELNEVFTITTLDWATQKTERSKHYRTQIISTSTLQLTKGY